MVSWLSGIQAQTGSVENWKYATSVGRLGEAAVPGGREYGQCPEFVSNALVFAIQLRKNHGKPQSGLAKGARLAQR